MRFDWEELKINRYELEKIFEPNLITSWAIALSGVLLLRYQKYNRSLLNLECSLLFISLLFCFPINLMFLRKLDLIVNSTSGLWIVIVNTIILSFVSLLAFNYYLWQKAKKLKLLAKLLKKVSDYNNLIDDIQVLANIDRLANKSMFSNTEKNRNTDKFTTILELTKNSILNSIELEKLIYNRRETNENSFSTLTLDRYRLLARLENNLVNVTLPEIDSNRDYREILNEAIDLGLSVHQEIAKIDVKLNRQQ